MWPGPYVSGTNLLVLLFPNTYSLINQNPHYTMALNTTIVVPVLLTADHIFFTGLAGAYALHGALISFALLSARSIIIHVLDLSHFSLELFQLHRYLRRALLAMAARSSRAEAAASVLRGPAVVEDACLDQWVEYLAGPGLRHHSLSPLRVLTSQAVSICISATETALQCSGTHAL